MRDRTQAKLNFIHKAMNGEYTADQAKAELDEMEREFGDQAFLPGKVAKKPRRGLGLTWRICDLRQRPVLAPGTFLFI